MQKVVLLVVALLISLTSANAFDAREVISPGGIKAWLVEDHTIPLVAMNFSLQGGAATDPAGKEGRAHFMASMLNEGAGDMDGPSFQSRTDELAIRMGFSANTDTFQVWLQTLTVNRAEAARLLKLALSSPTFPPDATDRVRRQIVVGARNAATDPGTIAWARAAAFAIPGHPYGRATNGNEASIGAITRDDLVEVHKLLIRRTGLTVSAVGDITANELGAMLDDVFGTLPATDLPSPAANVKVKDGPYLEVFDFDNPQTLVLFGQPGISDSDPDYIPAVVMMELLGGSSSQAWLGNEVREKRGLTYGIQFDLQVLPHTAFLAGSFSTSNETAAEALAVVRQTIKRMAEVGPTQAELDDIKTYMTGSYPLRFDSTNAISSFLTGIQLTNRPITYANERNGLIEKVTLDQVKDVAKRLLKPDKLIVVAVGKPVGVK